MLPPGDFPLQEPAFAHEFGVRALPQGQSPWRRTGDFAQQLRLKKRVRRLRPDISFATVPGSLPLCEEVAHWVADTAPWVQAHAGRHPLEDVGLQIQEDLAVMADAPGFPLVAGLVCLPSGWSVRDKLGLTMGATHSPVPGFATHMQEKTERLFASMPPLRPVYRRNWALSPAGRLAAFPDRIRRIALDRDAIDAANAGRRCRLRVEYQTLTRMPQTGAIVFTILTLQCQLETLNPEQKGLLAGVLDTCPEDTLRYKGLKGFHAPVLEYLRS